MPFRSVLVSKVNKCYSTNPMTEYEFHERFEDFESPNLISSDQTAI